MSMPKFIEIPNESGIMYINTTEIIRFWDVGVRLFGTMNKYASIMAIRSPELPSGEVKLTIPLKAQDIMLRIQNA
jgi:hypothetical protein